MPVDDGQDKNRGSFDFQKENGMMSLTAVNTANITVVPSQQFIPIHRDADGQEVSVELTNEAFVVHLSQLYRLEFIFSYPLTDGNKLYFHKLRELFASEGLRSFGMQFRGMPYVYFKFATYSVQLFLNWRSGDPLDSTLDGFVPKTSDTFPLYLFKEPGNSKGLINTFLKIERDEQFISLSIRDAKSERHDPEWKIWIFNSAENRKLIDELSAYVKDGTSAKLEDTQISFERKGEAPFILSSGDTPKAKFKFSIVPLLIKFNLKDLH